MGKYTEVAKTLPRAVPDAGWQARVNAKKAELVDRRPGALALRYKGRKLLKEALEEALTEVNAGIVACEQLAWEALEDQNLESVKIEGGGFFGKTDDVSVKATDPARLLAWVREKGMEGLLTLNAKTLESLVKERLVEKVPDPVPPGVEVAAYVKTTFRKS